MNATNNSGNGERYFIRKEIERMNGNIEKLLQEVTNLKVEIAMLKVKSNIWGGTTGGIVGAIVSAIAWFSRSG